LTGLVRAGEGLALRAHDLHDAQAGHDAVAGALDVAEDDVAGLLAAKGVAVLAHAGIHVLVAHRGGLVAELCLVKGLEQPVVRT
jgi:hypothetical protein